MSKIIARASALLASGLLCSAAFAGSEDSSPVKTIPVYVQPYYESARQEGGHPKVAVGDGFDKLLESNDPKSVLAAAAKVESAPEWVTPMTMMALSIRLYDVGERDRAVFWFYASKDRYYVSKSMLDYSDPNMSGVAEAMGAFIALAGPFLNGYAFCDLAAQQRISRQALDWTRSHPYDAYMNPAVPSKKGDPRQLELDGLAKGEAAFVKEKAWIEDPANRSKLMAGREASHAKERFCW